MADACQVETLCLYGKFQAFNWRNELSPFDKVSLEATSERALERPDNGVQ